MIECMVRNYTEKDLPEMIQVWNEVVEEGIAYPQIEMLTAESGAAFFASQSFSGVAELDEKIVGLYILHPNNIGRCGHISNASFAVSKECRGKHIGEQLVCHCMKMGTELGFKILQFNAVVKTNYGAIHLYEKLGFVRLGIIPGGFRMKDGSYEDIIVFYHTL